MTAEDARKKYEEAFWVYMEMARVSRGFMLEEGAECQLEKLLHRMLCDGFKVTILTSASDGSKKGLAFHEVSKEIVDSARKQFKQKYKEEPF